MPRRSLPQTTSALFSSVLLLATTGLVAPGCQKEFDTTRAEPVADVTLGEQIFTTLCDRIGAGSITEDISGASYHTICHKSEDGWGDTVDDADLPRPTGAAKEARRLGVAKMEVLAKRRAELIEAFDAIFPDTKIDDPFVAGKQVNLQTAMNTMMQRMTPLYEDSPYKDRPSEPYLMPASTEAMGRMLGTIAADGEAVKAMARIGQRRGYRPQSLGLGAIRPLLAYPELRKMVRLLVDRVGPGGKFEPAFQRLLRVAEQELRTATADPQPSALQIDKALQQPNRARGTLEILQTVMLAEDAAYQDPAYQPRFIAARDLRGFAIPAGLAKGQPLPAPFADSDGDGYSDVDAFGRFIGADGAPAAVAPPFRVVGLTAKATFDTLDRPLANDKLLYTYVDTSRSFVGSVLRDVDPMLQPVADGSQSTVMKALEGAYVLYGDTKLSKTKYDGAVFPYTAFDSESSPLLDLTYAAGQVLGAPESDDYMASISTLHSDYPEKTARLLELIWKLRDESKKPAYAKATLADSSIFWDEFALWLARVARVGKEMHISKNPQAGGLLSDMTLALTHPDLQKYIGSAYGSAWRNKDKVVYNPEDVNGPPINAATKKVYASGVALSEPVDRSKADEEGNESAFRRFVRVIHESRGVKTCNRANAHIKTSLNLCGNSLPELTYPLCLQSDPDKCQNGFNECSLFQIDDLGTFFVDSILPYDHPRRAILNIKDDVLGGLLTAVDNLLPNSCDTVNLDNVLEATSGLKGLSTKPTPQALARLVFFAVPDKKGTAPVDPYLDGKNKGIAQFISSTTSLIGTNLCPKNDKGVQVCTDYNQTLRARAGETLLSFETPYLDTFPAGCTGADCTGPTSGFYAAMRPLLTTFANYNYKPETSDNCVRDEQGLCRGEDLFGDMIDILDRHWGSANGGSSLYNYEEFLSFVLENSDLLGTAADLVPTLRNQSIASRTGTTRSGLEISQSLVGYLLDPKVAAANGIVDRQGANTGVWNNGKVQPQTTPYELLVRGLRGFDARFAKLGDAGSPEKLTHWRDARSTLVDQFLLASGGKWKNAGVQRALPGILDLTRQQVNARCPNRATDGQCAWARKELTDKLTTVIEGPLFSAIAEFQESIRGDDELRTELEKLLAYLLEQAKDPATLSLTLASLADLMQVLHDDANIVPILHAAAPVARPSLTYDVDPSKGPTEVKDPGASDTALRLLRVMMDDREDLDEKRRLDKVVDRYHVLDRILPNLVTPASESKRAPLEVLIDVAADVNRIDSSSEDPLSPEDYGAIFHTVDAFLTDDTRGMEQFYTIVRGRNGN
jgi:hypothetical protein